MPPRTRKTAAPKAAGSGRAPADATENPAGTTPHQHVHDHPHPGHDDHGDHDHDHGDHDHAAAPGDPTHRHSGPGGAAACTGCVIAAAGHGGHHDWDHFPTDAELAEVIGVDDAPSATELARLLGPRRFDPAPAPSGAGGPDLLPLPEAARQVLTAVRPLRLDPAIHRGILNLIMSYRRVRRNHLSLSASERTRVNTALAAMDGNPAWTALLNEHATGVHRMHSMHGAVGRERFLPWHRRYLYEAEQMLRTVDATLTLPYWDYAADHTRPDWVHRPAGVTRPATGSPTGFLPTGATIAVVLAHGDYTGFTSDLESNAHNQVHNWSGGTLRSPATASFDPIFWMLHANVDRLWATWQETHHDPALHVPSLTGADRVLDPWTSRLEDVDAVAWDLGYRYG